MSMMEIDGSMGEGGGQILRTALSISAMTGQAVGICNIRANRQRPGLKRQHLTAARAVAEICNGQLSGDEVGSREMTFRPGKIRGGEYHFSIGTAGSTVLVAQTILPILLQAEEPSTVLIEGGTHIYGAPPFEFFNEVYLPQLRLMGCEVTATIERYGFFPAGGGTIRLSITPQTARHPYWMMETGALVTAEVVVLSSGIDIKIAEDEADIMAHQVREFHPVVTIREVDSICSGNAAYLKLTYENITEMFSSIGSLERSRKAVANDVIHQYKKYSKIGLPVGPYLTDQVLLPLFYLCPHGFFRSGPWSRHAQTNLKVLNAFQHAFEWEAHDVGNGIEFAAALGGTIYGSHGLPRRQYVEQQIYARQTTTNPNPEMKNEMDEK